MNARLNFVQEKTIEDFDIILEVLTGNRGAYAEIVRRHETRVRGYCLMMLSNSAQAEDAAQEVFIKAYQALGRFRGRSSFSTWLYRITVNHCTDMLRKTSRERSESWEALLDQEGEKMEALFAASAAGGIPAEQSELVAKLLSRLSEKSRAILILREMHELSYQELAETLGCSLDAIKARLKRARQEIEIKLRHILRVENV